MNISNLKPKIVLLLFCTLLTGWSYGQENSLKELSINEVIELALQNHQELKVTKATIAVANQQKEVSKLQRIPTVTFSANALYLGNVLLLDKDFSKVGTTKMPHFGNTFGLQASQLLFKGGAINKSIEIAALQTQLAELDLVNDLQSVKFLVISNYLDIKNILNQIQVIEQNKTLARQRLANVSKSYEQGLVTRNEVIRADLQIKNLDQSLLSITNNHAVLSNQLSYALGLPPDVLIIPTSEADDKIVQDLKHYIELAHQNHPGLQSVSKNLEIAEKNISLIKTERIPSISAIGGYNMQRPLTSSTPAMDMYSNTWQAGISLSYNIDNLYKNKQKIKLGEKQTNVLEETFTLTQQNIEIGVNAAYIRYNEAVQQAKLSEEAQKLANENYKIIEAKYLNQLAITAEMTDAATAKLDTELQYANAVIEVMFQYYNLLKSTGTL